MLKRVLVYLANDETLENTLKYAAMLKEKFGTKVNGLYVKDVRKYEIFTPVAEGILIENSPKQIINEWEKLEEKGIESVKEKYEEILGGEGFIVEEGIVPEVIIEILKGYDLLVVGKNEKIGQDLKALLRMHFRPMIVVPPRTVFKMDKVLFACDGGTNASKSAYNFVKNFENMKKIDIVSVNAGPEKNLTIEYLAEYGILSERFIKSGDPVQVIIKEAMNYDMLIMGDLKYFFIFEKLTGKAGVNILEKAGIPVFIG